MKTLRTLILVDILLFVISFAVGYFQLMHIGVNEELLQFMDELQSSQKNADDLLIKVALVLILVQMWNWKSLWNARKNTHYIYLVLCVIGQLHKNWKQVVEHNGLTI